MTIKTSSKPWKASFAVLWISQAFSLFGTQLVSFALIWYLAESTGSAVVLATAAAISLLPQVLLGPVAGALVDSWNRKWIMLAADATTAVGTLGLIVLFQMGDPVPWNVYGLILVRAVASVFHGPAMIASTSLIVPENQLTRVQGWNQALGGGLNIAAAPIAALLLSFMTIQSVLFIDVVTAILAIGLLCLICIPQPDRSKSRSTNREGATGVFADIRDGGLYIWRWGGLRTLLLMGVIFNALLQPALTLLPIVIRRMQAGSVLSLGSVQAAFGSGIILGGAVLSVWGGFSRRVGTVVLGLGMLGISMIGAGIPMGGVVWLAGCMLSSGMAMAFIHGALFAIIQAKVAPDLQGRVLAMTMSTVGLAVPLSLFFAGSIADRSGPEYWFVAAGIACLSMGILAYASPAVWKMEEREAFAALSECQTSEGCV